MKHSYHLLLCDDDVNLSSVIAEFLRGKGYEVDIVADGTTALDNITKSHYDVCIVDVNLPLMDGIEVLTNIRMMDKELPVIMLADNSNLDVMLAAYEKGCDDVMVKPLSIELLVYKMEAIIRRQYRGVETKETIYQIGSLRFDAVNQTIGDKRMSSRESDLLWLLCQYKGETIDRHQILRTLWKTDDHFSSRSLCVYINHLRKYLVGTGARIQAVHNCGYKFIY